MLSKLFRNRVRFDELDPVARRQAVLDITDAEIDALQADLAELARSDDDGTVRRAALERLRDVDQLSALLGHDDTEIAAAAAAALAARATADASASGLLELPGVREAALRSARDPAEAEALAAALDDLATVRLALECRNAKVRLALAERVYREDALTELERHSRDRDKNVHRLARTRLDDIKHARAEQARGLERVLQLVGQLQSLSQIERLTLTRARLAHLRDDWLATLARLNAAQDRLRTHGAHVEPLPEATSRFDALAEALQQRIETNAGAEREQDPQPQAIPQSDDADALAFETARNELSALMNRVQTAQVDPVERLSEIHAEHFRLQQLWLSHADRHPPPEALAAEFHELTHRMHLVLEAAERTTHRQAEINAELGPLPEPRSPASPEHYHALWDAQRRARQTRSRIERLWKRLSWPDGIPMPQRLAALSQRAAQLEAFDVDCHSAYERLIEECKSISTDLEHQIDEGHLNPAVGLEAEGKRLLRSLPAGAAKHYHQRFNWLTARLQELKDWQNFATGPKRRELCEQVEALADHPLAPKSQAERIKALRRAWNELGPITHYRDRRLLDRFNVAAEKAFEPCRAYFEAEAEKRRFNLEQRDVICHELERYLAHNNWDHPDWKGVERIMHTAQQEWRKFYPVDRSAGRKTQQRFEALCHQLHDRLKAEWDRNITAKEDIVADAGRLRDSLREDPGQLHAVIEQAKALQRNWRGVGITPRGADQRLWKAFRGTCDDIFGFRDQSRHDQQQALDERAARVESLCSEFQQRLASATVDNGGLAALKRELDALGELPRDTQVRLQTQVRELEAAHRRALQERQRRLREQELTLLEVADRQMGELELAVARGEITAIDAVQERLSTLTADTGDAGERQMAPRIHTLERTLTQQELARFESLIEDAGERRYRLTVETEIRAGLESPAEDQQRRLALQVERLNQGFKQPGRIEQEDALALARRWCEIGPWDANAPALSKRFFNACAQLAAGTR
jgi:DNA repair protein SbcC/Rad50